MVTANHHARASAYEFSKNKRELSLYTSTKSKILGTETDANHGVGVTSSPKIEKCAVQSLQISDIKINKQGFQTFALLHFVVERAKRMSSRPVPKEAYLFPAPGIVCNSIALVGCCVVLGQGSTHGCTTLNC